ncbi:MAG TPA: GNAT family N-acetyltransferase [Clostridiaceae bacterium]|nr:GNAT family N-acetyltransferase [Clostridiaceae bacterium]
MLTPEMSTERLILRPLVMEDAEKVFSRWAGDPDNTRFMQWDTHKDISVTREWLNTEVLALKDDHHYNWAVINKEDGEIIGSMGFYMNGDKGLFEIGYIIMKSFWGRGLVTEAAKRIILFAKEKLGAKEMFAKHAVDNIGSGRVLEKLGFKFQGLGTYNKFSGTETFESKEYLLRM